MKCFKKVLALAVAGVVSLSMIGCSKSPELIYKEVVEKSQQMNSMDCTAKMTMSIKQGENSMDMTSDMDMKMTGAVDGDIKYAAKASMGLMGQSFDTNVYYTDGYYYTEMMDQKIKYPMDLEKMRDQVKTAVGNPIEAEYMKELTAEKKDGNTVLNYTADPAKMQSYVKDIMGSMGDSLPGMDQVEYNIKEVSGTLTVNKESYPIHQTTHMDMDVTMMGETVGMEMDIDMTYNNPGQDVQVELPSDLDQYVETQVPDMSQTAQ